MPTNRSLYAISGLLTGATVWGVVWYPFRLLDGMGVNGIASTLIVFAIALSIGLIAYRHALREINPSAARLIWIGLAAGWTNLAYVVAVIHGEVVRVMLLFYLAPLWTVFFARYFLDERLNKAAILVMALALSGAVVMLWHPELGKPWPKSGAEWIAITAGIAFALTNVLTRQAAQFSVQLKALAVWSGVVGVALIWALIEPPQWQAVAQLEVAGYGLLFLVGLVIFIATAAMQYGLTHTPANQAIVILLFELVVVAVSSYYLAHETLSLQEWIGGAMIVAASIFSGMLEKEKSAGA
ncbi:MAG: DMT family transporter [Burkholderiales bacterium]|nr:DMT family transporter [Burkholderiales bacterium]